jgi:hypothetical protein
MSLTPCSRTSISLSTLLTGLLLFMSLGRPSAAQSPRPTQEETQRIESACERLVLDYAHYRDTNDGDRYAALFAEDANDKKIYVVLSLDLVVARQGGVSSPGADPAGVAEFDNALLGRICRAISRSWRCSAHEDPSRPYPHGRVGTPSQARAVEVAPRALFSLAWSQQLVTC